MSETAGAEPRMPPGERRRRRLALAVWRLFNPLAIALAGVAPWWVVLETTGRRTGLPRRVPLARGPVDGDRALLICVHGRHASFARNIAAQPGVRLKIRGRWRRGRAALLPLDRAVLVRFSRYARLGPRSVGIEPMLIALDLEPEPTASMPDRSSL